MSNYVVRLVGGPSGLTGAVREQRVESLEDTVKIHYRNGYEQFCYSGEDDESATPRYVWVRRTKIAE